MPGFSGIINTARPLAGLESIRQRFERVQELENVDLCHRSYTSESCVIVNTYTGLFRDSRDQPAVDVDGNTRLFLHGEVFNDDLLRKRLDEKGATVLFNRQGRLETVFPIESFTPHEERCDADACHRS